MTNETPKILITAADGIRAEGINFSEEVKAAAVAKAKSGIAALAA